jgi:hypothetical protein
MMVRLPYMFHRALSGCRSPFARHSYAVWPTRVCLPAALQVFRHVLGQRSQHPRQQQDELLFSEADPKHFVTLTRTKDWRYVLINSHAKLSSEVRHGQGGPHRSV